MRLPALALACASLAGCDVPPGLGGSSQPVQAMFLLGGDVVVNAPDGYCIDQGASRSRSGFAVMAGCALVSDAQIMPFRDGLITVQVGEAGTAAVAGSEGALRELLASAAGVGLLSSSGDPAAVTIDRLDSQSNLVSVHFTDATPPPFDGLEQAEWRAFFDLGDRLATVTVRGFARAPMSEAAGLALLQQAVAALQAANVPGAAIAVADAG